MGASGPYIVTTWGECLGCLSPSTHPHNVAPPLSRVAVGTLEEARLSVRTIIIDAALADGTTDGYPPAHLASWAEEAFPESGGSVGPLPDGTLIQVESLSPLILASKCGASGELVMSCLRADDFQPLCDAYNARGPHRGQ